MKDPYKEIFKKQRRGHMWFPNWQKGLNYAGLIKLPKNWVVIVIIYEKTGMAHVRWGPEPPIKRKIPIKMAKPE